MQREQSSQRAAAVRLIVGVVVLAVAIAGPGVVGRLSSGSRLDPAARAAAESNGAASVVVTLNFEPEKFHLRELQAYGSVGLVNGDQIELQRITYPMLLALADLPWIAHISLGP